MNIFYTNVVPDVAARELPDKHIVKMPVEAVQMLVSACNRWGVDHGVLTKAGTVHQGGYSNHPCTLWAGECRSNFHWTLAWGKALCEEYTKRYGKRHFAEGQIDTLSDWSIRQTLPINGGHMTTPALAMPDECKTTDPVESYKNCIRAKVAEKPKSFVWAKGTDAPSWL
jgi:hypothetical protein